MKSSYVSNFNASDDEDIFGDEYQPTTDVDLGSPRSPGGPIRGYVAPGTPPASASGSEGDTKINKKVQQVSRRVVPLPSDDTDSEFELEDIDKPNNSNNNSNSNNNDVHTGIDSPIVEQLEQSPRADDASKSSDSELDLGNVIDIDEALERSLHGAYTSSQDKEGSSPSPADASNDSVNEGKRKKNSDEENDNVTPKKKKKKKNSKDQDDGK